MAKWTFSARCPEGHEVAQYRFSQDSLKRLLFEDEDIQLYCVYCRRFWDADDFQRRTLGESLDEHREWHF